MKSDVARQSLTATVLVSAALSAVAVAAVVRLPHPSAPSVCAMPAGWLERGFSFLPAWAGAALWVAVALLCAVLATRLVNRYSVAVTRIYLPMVFYTVVSCGLLLPLAGLPELSGIAGLSVRSAPAPDAAALVVPPLLLAATSLQIESFRRSYQFGTFFLSAFYLGLLPLLYAPSLPLVLLVPVATVLYGRTAREFAVAAVGAVLPLLLVSFALWVSGRGGLTAACGIGDALVSNAGRWGGFAVTPVSLLTAALVLVSGVLAVAGMAGRWRELRTRPRKIYRHCWWMLVLGCAGLPFSGSAAASLGILAVPLSILLPAQFLRGRSIAGAAVYALLLVWILLINLFAC